MGREDYSQALITSLVFACPVSAGHGCIAGQDEREVLESVVARTRALAKGHRARGRCGRGGVRSTGRAGDGRGGDVSRELGGGGTLQQTARPERFQATRRGAAGEVLQRDYVASGNSLRDFNGGRGD